MALLVFAAAPALLLILGIVLAIAISPWWWALAAAGLALTVVAVVDFLQPRNSILRNFPLLGHARFLLEEVRPMIQQYFIERNWDGKPFDRDARALIYDRSAGRPSVKSFGTELEVRQPGYEFLTHSIAPAPVAAEEHRVRIGGPDCAQPYDASLFNISSMSYGSLSANAVKAMGAGAAKGGFLHETGEGGLTQFHLDSGADIGWEFGSGYFGCRTTDGHFSPEAFREKALLPQIKLITLKLSQGAKPGLGGVLPAPKVTEEIAQIRGVPAFQDCISPPAHSAYSTPRELLEFIGELRRLSDGKPVGFKLCVGTRRDVLALCKAMRDTGIRPDFIIVDGAEGGTGAAPLEYQDHMGTPLTEGLTILHEALVGAGLRDGIRIGAAGKVASGHDIVRRLIQGADFCLAARPMMMAVGCIQAQKCHTDHCPTGIATQDPRFTRGLDPVSKGERVFRYHRATVTEVAQLIATLGARGPHELDRSMLMRRVSQTQVVSYAELTDWLQPGQLLSDAPAPWTQDWQRASADSFAATRV
jgi:glutamate synthase domain-containing protein 2